MAQIPAATAAAAPPEDPPGVISRFLGFRVWRLTPNSGVLAAKIAASAATSGLRTLIFSQSIPNAASIAGKAAAELGQQYVELTDSETELHTIAVDEMGCSDLVYLDVDDGRLSVRAATHHGLLLPEERELTESLYRRAGALMVLAATPTLGQGINLPADLVIIAEDSKFDADASRREVLDPADLLNAAGRAGRAGESATGIVLVIPGQVVPLNETERTIGNRWTRLRSVFGLSDQCLVIDDPFTAIMDKIHHQTSEITDLDRYVVARLTEMQPEELRDREIRLGLSKSFGAYRKRRDGDEDWVKSRTASALALLSGAEEEEGDRDARPYRDLSSMLGMPEDVLKRLSLALSEARPDNHSTVEGIRDWMFEWLGENPPLLFRVLKPSTLEDVFGKELKNLTDEKERADYVIPRLRGALTKWMNGEPLKNVQPEISEKTRELRYCTGARKFLLRIVPELAHLMGAPAKLMQHFTPANDPAAIGGAAALLFANRCVRRGFSSSEMAALSIWRRSSRREIHREFETIFPYIMDAPNSESRLELEARVASAVETERISREFDDLL